MKNLLLLILLFRVSVPVFSQADLTRGLVAYYPFNGNANDVSGNGLNGIERNGIQLTSDKYGNPNSAYLFDGIDDYIEILDDPKLRFRDSFSVCISYMHLDNTSGNLIEKRDFFTGQNTSFDMAAGSLGANGAVKTINDCTNAATGADYTLFTQPPVTNSWYCIVMTFNAGTLNFYENGVLISSTTTFSNKVDSCEGSNIRIGYHLIFDPIAMYGKIDEVRLYNRAITQDEINAYCDANTGGPNNCLRITNDFDYAAIGDLDVTGNQITVEAIFNANTKYFLPGTVAFDLVSKHTGPSDCNYLLRPVTAEITTTNGFYQVVACDYMPQKINHAALVYNGTTLKFYRNGFLMGSMPASGNLVTNDLITKIGNYAALTRSEALKGYINEVRIWNVARTQQQIKDYMFSSLPEPGTQAGLLAYYVFNNLSNKQGNSVFDAMLNNNAAIGITSPNTILVADSCLTVVPVTMSGFTAFAGTKKTIQVNWHAEEESSIVNYVIEKSISAGGPFFEIGLVNVGNKSTGNDYLFTDNAVKPGVIYFYRIKATEISGTKKYSIVKNAIINTGGLQVNVYPVPAHNTVTIQLVNSNESAVINLYSYAGELLIRKKIVTGGSINLDIEKLPKGNYTLQVNTAKETVVRQVEKL